MIQNVQNNNVDIQRDTREELRRNLETLIEHKCKQMGRSSFSGRCNAIHLEQWMKWTLEVGNNSPILEAIGEEWTPEMVRKRSEELQLIDSHGNITSCYINHKRNNDSNNCDEVPHDHPGENESPSKSTTTESQITVRSSPLMSETVPVCRQCHKNCLSNVLSNTNSRIHSASAHHNCRSATSNGVVNGRANETVATEEIITKNGVDEDKEDWRSFFLMGLSANPVASLMKCDPFQRTTPNISIIPPTNENCNSSSGDNQNHALEKSSSLQTTSDTPDDSPQTEEPPYHSLTSSALTLRRYGTVSSLERLGSDEKDEEDGLDKDSGDMQGFTENPDEIETDSLEDHDDEEDVLGQHNEATNHSAILSWTAKAGSYVAEKMSFFEKLSEDYRSGGGFFERYLKSNDNYLNGEEVQEEETSGGTSGEEIWGTPTSGGDLDDPPNSPNLEDKLSPNHDSLSDTMDDTEFMMDELLMTPPISGAVIRGLLPRRTLEPLIEEDFSESSSDNGSSESSSSKSNPFGKRNPIGSVADICSPIAAITRSPPNHPNQTENYEKYRNYTSPTNDYSKSLTNSPDLSITNMNEHQRSETNLANGCSGSLEMKKSIAETESNQQLSSPTTESMATAISSQSTTDCEEEKCQLQGVTFNMPRSESYRKIVEAAEEKAQEHVELDERLGTSVAVAVEPTFFENFRQTAKFVSIQKVPKSKSDRIFEFFNVRRTERRVYEQFPENEPLINTYSRENLVSDEVPISYEDKPISTSKILKDKQTDRRFWRQISKRKGGAKNESSSA